GSGCIAITLSKIFPNAEIFALEKSPDAIFYLKKNITLHNANVTIIQDDVLSPKTDLKDFDVIVSNPPYLTQKDMEQLQLEVKFEPQMALYGNEDGLLFYNEITKIWKDRQTFNGKIFFEIGKGQENDVIKILQENNYINICKTPDLYGIIRDISATRNY
ncbi:MAG: HemK family protein methyltransferase, partial [Oscillospiraceae bacterium]